MTGDGDGTDADHPFGEDYGGFVFDEDNGGSTSEGSALPSLEQRLAPVVALLVVVSLVLTGGYILFTALNGSSEEVLGSTGGSDDPGAPNGSGGSTTAPTSTTDTVTATATSTAPTTTTDRAVERTTADRTDVQPTATPTGETTTTTAAATPTETAEATTTATTTSGDEAGDAPTMTTATTAETPTATARPESRSPSIDSLSTERRADDGNGSTSLAVDWAVSDPDGDLETVEIAVVEEPEDGGQVVARRTIEVGGSDASDGTVFTIDGVPSGAYEIRLEATDDAGNVALAVTRDAPEE